FAGDVEADREIAQRFHIEIDGVADDQRAGADHRRRLAAERQLAIAAGGNPLADTIAQRNTCAADRELLIAVEIGEPDAQPRATERRADDETQSLVLERAFIDRDETGCPSANPFLA